MLSSSYMRSLDGDAECLDALAYLADSARSYPGGRFTPPFTARVKSQEAKPFLSMLTRLRRPSLDGSGVQVRALEIADEHGDVSITGACDAVAEQFAACVLRAKNSGTLIVTSDSGRHVLDVWLDSLGPTLLRLGFILQPMMTAGNVSFIVIRKGRSKWSVTTFEGMTGKGVSYGIQLAELAGSGQHSSRPTARHLYDAIGAYAVWLSATFGCAIAPTVGMIAMSAARYSMDRSVKKWRPEPLRVAFERDGKGYRGGMTYGKTYRGPTWRVDVNRQYSSALACALPLRSAFGRVLDSHLSAPCVAVCRVRAYNLPNYPIPVYGRDGGGFVVDRVSNGSYVSVLHSAEIRCLRDWGCDVEPLYGYVATATFNMSGHVAILQEQLDRFGRDDPRSTFCKPLGNYVYGKFGQLGTRTELLYSDGDMRPEWWPYCAPDGTWWESVWERDTEKVGITHHVDVAATITAYARAQTVSTWRQLSDAGLTVVRCHTDSLTVTGDPTTALSLSDTQIGAWRLEHETERAIIVGANAYFDGDTAHVAGITNPTFELVDRLADGQVVSVSQKMKSPRHGFVRGDIVQERELRAR